MPTPRKSDTTKRPRRPPGKTPEDRENQLIAMAVDLAEKQISEGTASAQVISHYLKLGTSRERLEQEKLRLDNELAKAKTEQIKSAARSEELFAEAIKAFRGYLGEPPEEEEDDPDLY